MTQKALPPESGSSAEATRANLIDAGFELFGAEGYAATSTRRLAERAGTNVASIAYHFGGKAGLHEACARAAAERIAQAVGVPRDHEGLSPEASVVCLERTLRGLVAMLVRGDAARSMVGFLVREMNASETTAQLLHDHFVAPKHRELCQLWSIATGQPAGSDEVKLAVFAMVGQALYFRVGQPVVRRIMGWEAVGELEADLVAEALVAQLRSAIERSRR
ncbi:MAG: CerR family C-terminal domain-containing protein [Salipiger thiooxidans]|uniref:CerR family C-terminal domain-containing protein n=1 Tax=Salipiger thiooxidans TaxID=282683 RepID=UPI001CF93734|nr:CerR family C-terminal domain-containing protein [Salipiger thiooxidans]